MPQQGRQSVQFIWAVGGRWGHPSLHLRAVMHSGACFFTAVTLIKWPLGTSAWCCYGMKFKLLKILQGQCWWIKKTKKQQQPPYNLGSRASLAPVLEWGCVRTWLNICKYGFSGTFFHQSYLFWGDIFRHVAWRVSGIKSVLSWKVQRHYLTLPQKSCSQLSQATDSATTYTGTFIKGTCGPSDCPSSSGPRIPSLAC